MGKGLLVAGIESSCDETAVGILQGDEELLSLVSSQEAQHAPYGGVVPELAARHHLEALPLLWADAMNRTGLKIGDLDGIAVTRGPGLAGALLAGVAFAKGLARAAGKPLVGVNHVLGHLAAVRLLPDAPQPPLLGLVVSGGHTELLWLESWEKARLIGETRDDAAGEALDKGARLLGLGYPGGPQLEALARGSKPSRRLFTLPLTKLPGYDYSFSGLKTALMLKARSLGQEELLQARAELAASYQDVVARHLARQAGRAARELGARVLVAAGGVLANEYLREALAEEMPGGLFVPPRRLCTDNGLMIASLGALRLARGEDDGAGMTVAVNWRADDRAEGLLER